MYFDVKAAAKISTRDRTLLRFLKSPGILVSASGDSSSHKTRILPENPDELCN